MIINMTGGGSGLNFAIVGGTTQPTNPRPNTIWVNTSTVITDWVFSYTEPTSPVSGMIWIRTGKSSPVAFNAVKKSGLYIYPTACYQYASGEWTSKTATSYIGSEWVDMKYWGTIIEDGRTDYTMNVIGKPIDLNYPAMTNPTIVSGDNCLEIVGTSGYGMAYFENIDLTDATKLTVTGTFAIVDTAADNAFNLAVWSSLGNYIRINMVASTPLTESGAELNVSSLTGKYIVGITMATDNIQKITNMRLE